MSALEYLDILNKKTKEKLIGLCLDKSILNSIDNSTNADDDEEQPQECLKLDVKFFQKINFDFQPLKKLR